MSEVNIYEYAMNLEKEGEEFYMDLAKRTQDEGLKNILLMLAKEEVKHYNMFKKMLDDADVSNLPKMEVFEETKSVFEKMKEVKQTHEFDIDQVEYYKKAVAIEEANENFYLKQADNTKNEEHKEIFLRIAEEERKHLVVLKNLVEFISAPDEYLDNAEFYSMNL